MDCRAQNHLQVAVAPRHPPLATALGGTPVTRLAPTTNNPLPTKLRRKNKVRDPRARAVLDTKTFVHAVLALVTGVAGPVVIPRV